MNNPENPKLYNYWFVENIRAAGASLEKAPDWSYRKITREYSIKYGVPLPQVRKMPFTEVFYEVLEGRLDNLSDKQLLEVIRDLIRDDNSEEKAIAERMKRYEEEEKLRVQKLKTKKPKVKKQKVTALMSENSEIILSKKYDLKNPEEE